MRLLDEHQNHNKKEHSFYNRTKTSPVCQHTGHRNWSEPPDIAKDKGKSKCNLIFNELTQIRLTSSGGVAVLAEQHRIDKLMSIKTVCEVWGVGRRISQQLESMGIKLKRLRIL